MIPNELKEQQTKDSFNPWSILHPMDHTECEFREYVSPNSKCNKLNGIEYYVCTFNPSSIASCPYCLEVNCPLKGE